MAQSSQSTPTVPFNMNGSTHQVNLRDYLNIRVAPFLKKAISESLDAAPEFPLQWLGEHLIHQSLLYEGNPDRTNIRERFLYSFESPATVPPTATPTYEPMSPQQPGLAASETTANSEANVNEAINTNSTVDTQMLNQTNGEAETSHEEPPNETRDTEMTETS